jgi:prepilin-type N-terminal cleavage/methylation domain-containing protein
MNTRGFTVVEILVVIGIVGLLALVVVLQFIGTNRNYGMENAESIVRADLRRAIILSTTGKICCVANQTPEGYGIVFTPGETAYRIYADVDGDHLYASTGSDEVIQEVDLEADELIDRVVIQSCSPALVLDGPCDFFVDAPGGIMYTNAELTTNLTVLLQQQDTEETISITVDLTSGQVN